MFVAGEPGVGHSSLFAWLAEHLPKNGGRPRVLHGTFADGPYRTLAPAIEADQRREFQDALVDVAKEGIGSLTTGLLAELLATALPAWRALEKARAGRKRLAAEELVPALLREAVMDRPLVCLLEEFDQSDSSWLSVLLLTMAQEFTEDLGIVFVLGVTRADEVAAILAERNLAETLTLSRLTKREISEWLGHLDLELETLLWEVSEGRSDHLAALWNEWRNEHVVELDAGNVWVSSRGADRLLRGPADAFAERLAGLLAGCQMADVDLIRRVLACGALEGRTFTADLVVDAVGDGAGERVIDLLDDYLAELLIAHDPVELNLRSGGQTYASTYTFRSWADWLIARRKLITDVERRRYAIRLTQTLHNTLESSLAVNRTAAQILTAAGEMPPAELLRASLQSESMESARSQAVLLSATNPEQWSRDASRFAANRLRACLWALMYVEPEPTVIDLAETAYAFAERSEADPERAYASWQSSLYNSDADQETATTRANQAVALCVDGRGDPHLHGHSLLAQARLARNVGRYQTAESKIEAALKIFSPSDYVGIGHANAERGQIERDRGRFDLARDLTRHALANAAWWERGHAIAQMAEISVVAGRFADARKEARQLLELAVRHGAIFLEGFARLVLVEVMVLHGELADAHAELQRLRPSSAQHAAHKAVLDGLVRASRASSNDELRALDVSPVMPLTRRIRLLVLMGRLQPARLDEAEAETRKLDDSLILRYVRNEISAARR